MRREPRRGRGGRQDRAGTAAMSYRLHFNESLADGVPRIAREQLERAVAQLTAGDAAAADAVHEVRKRCKKIRGLLRLTRGSFGDLVVLRMTLARRNSNAPGEHAQREAVAALAARRQERLRTQAQPLGWRLFADKPADFGACMQAFWAAAACETVRDVGPVGGNRDRAC
jgi:hypothetical protein